MHFKTYLALNVDHDVGLQLQLQVKLR